MLGKPSWTPEEPCVCSSASSALGRWRENSAFVNSGSGQGLEVKVLTQGLMRGGDHPVSPHPWEAERYTWKVHIRKNLPWM